MECNECKKLLSLFLDGQIDQRQQEEMRNHLKECANCAQALESLTKMINLMRQMKEVEPVPDFIQKVNNRLDRQGFWENVETNIKIFWQTRGPVRAIAVLATVVLAVYASIEVSKLDLGGRKGCELFKSCPEKEGDLLQPKEDDTSKYKSKKKLDALLTKKPESKAIGHQADVLNKVPLAEKIRPRESAQADRKNEDVKSQSILNASGAKLEEKSGKYNFNGMVVGKESSIDSRLEGKAMNIPAREQVNSVREPRPLMKAADSSISAKVGFSSGEKPQSSSESVSLRPGSRAVSNGVKTETYNNLGYKEKKESLPRTAVLIIKPGNLIALYREQKWALSCQDLEKAKQELSKLLVEFKAEGVKVEERQKDGTLISIFSGTIRYRQVPLLIGRVEQLGKLNMLTPLPMVRPEVYTSARGGFNPLVLEELISVEISLSL